MKALFDRLARVGLNAFFLCLVLMVVLAWLFPGLGADDSALHLGTITTYGVSFIFFFYGVSLDPVKLKTGLRNWRLHLVIQLTTFVLFPIVAWVILYFFGTASNPLWLGFYYLAVLPSTVSSSVVMVSIAGGNVPAAIFNASISSIIGIFVTPLWMSLYSQGEGDIALIDVIIKLCLQVLLPVIVGLLLHNKLGSWAEKNKGWLRKLDQLTILLIVFTAFSESFLEKMFDGFTALEIGLLSVAMVSFFLIMALLMHLLSSALRFPREDRITVIFCGSKKSIVQGAVMGKVLFGQGVSLGIVLLPLMLYHALQLMAGSILAQAMNNSPRSTVHGPQ
jgi:sodium/bile acid cotransporter 7